MLPSLPHASGAYVATLRGDWEAFHRSRRSAKARRQDRAKLKRLRQHGEVSLAMPRDRVEMESAIDALLAQRSKTFARKGIGNKFSRAGFRNLLVALASGPQTRSMVHISRLDVGGRPAALNFGLQYRGRYLLCLVSYDEKLSRESPGALHLTELIRRAVNLGMQEFDFLVGHQRLKAEWCDHRRALLDHIAAVNLRGWPVAVLARAFGRLKRAIKNSNTSWEVYLRLRRFGPALIRALRRD
jgi:CelD/BcsL family acetyltransferase involved in cellulose biosynthesis